MQISWLRLTFSAWFCFWSSSKVKINSCRKGELEESLFLLEAIMQNPFTVDQNDCSYAKPWKRMGFIETANSTGPRKLLKIIPEHQGIKSWEMLSDGSLQEECLWIREGCSCGGLNCIPTTYVMCADQAGWLGCENPLCSSQKNIWSLFSSIFVGFLLVYFWGTTWFTKRPWFNRAL